MILVEVGGTERGREVVGNYLEPWLFIEALNQASSLKCKILVLMIISNSGHTSVDVEKRDCSSDCCRAFLAMEIYGFNAQLSPSFANKEPNICCQGFGITCDGSSVIEISWDGRGLSGSIPESLEHMTNLKKLNLSHNALSGDFPDFLAKTSITDL